MKSHILTGKFHASVFWALIAILSMALSPKASALDICGLVKVNGTATAGVNITAYNCKTGLVAATGVTGAPVQRGDGFYNYHLLNGAGRDVRLVFDYQGCQVEVDCATVLAATILGKGKATINVDITCKREPPTTCRVTGGGVLLPGTVDQSCIEVNTTIIPFTTPNGLTIKKITHGGQLGAPFSQLDCGEILGNPCIRGQWQHTRHYEGKANPRDVFDMNFHSVTQKGQFDSLNCACLGCCDPESGVFITPIIVGGLCNPDDHKVCGPQPRPAPANAIIFSGVGRLTPTDSVKGSRAAQAEWVVFRVYIEDRSEPGGFHPNGAVEPADIYCFQAWKTGISVSKKPDFSTVSAAFRRALGLANCAFLADLQSGALPIGSLPSPVVLGLTAHVQDCGPLHDGNHQIHPATGATCTE